ncbi:hypothetical protein PM10SUCC1_26280 [Propionigenium maris DSM 9537]|uniref:GGDEF domain-containing protein n=1 Tax=Propionigenium maris DSM 9537 TaxID=1123000 RepID=A0A9W6GL53_9FUSO|nr:GGDEF domain-containing protein [Propionigenium maris]GLI57114.1 hypothetical protein PM10SUCC1_26280 [Propionigenium maris DSM 9537]
MNYLHMNTLIINYIFISYITTLIILHLWFSYGRTFRGLKFFLGEFILHSAGLTLAAFWRGLPPTISVLLPNILMFSSILLLLLGMGCFLELNIQRRPYYIYTGVFTTTYLYYVFIAPDVRIRIVLFSAMTIPIFLHVAYLIFWGSPNKLRKHALGVGWLSLLFIAVNTLRILYALAQGRVEGYFSTPMMDGFFVLLSQGLTVLLAFLLEVMIISNLFSRADEAADEREGLLERTRLLATTDSLTGVWNRRRTEEILAGRVERLKNYGTPFSLLLADIDHFKRVNDTYGHQVGDRVLVDVTRITRENIRSSDSLGRWGGEEFLIILPKLTLTQALETAERLRRAVMEYEAEYLPEGERITMSIGVVEGCSSKDIEGLLTGVDELLYRAKDRGRNRVEFGLV